MKVFPVSLRLSSSLVSLMLVLSSPFCTFQARAADGADSPAKDLSRVKKYNLGVVLNGGGLTVYRSSSLGRDGLAFLKNHLAAKNLPFPKTIVYLNKEGYKKNLTSLYQEFALEEYKLQEQYQFRFFHSFDQKNRTFLDGENPYLPSEDIDSTKNLGPEAIRLFGLHYDDKKDGGVDDLVRIIDIILDKANQPVLFHCFGGRHRSGMVSMAIRYMQGGDWVTGEKRRVFIPILMKHLWLNPAQYEYAFYNRDLFRPQNVRFIEKFSTDKRFLLLQEKYRQQLRELAGPVELPSYQ